MACDHRGNFQAALNVTKAASGATTYSMAITLACSTCAQPFEFKGVPTLSALTAGVASTTADKRTLIVPVGPAT